jgi:hypothetical protein
MPNVLFAFQGLGVDMLWHGVEINHAVYSLLLQVPVTSSSVILGRT